MPSPLRTRFKRLLQQTGLHDLTIKARRGLDPAMIPYRGIKRHTSSYKGVPVSFTTEDMYSKRWFFPRYEGGKLHEKTVTEMIADAVSDADVFVDVGAHIGWYTCVAAMHMPGGQVYSFELDDINVEIIDRNVAVNGCQNVSTHTLAVSDTSEMVTYERGSANPSPILQMNAPGSIASGVNTQSVRSTSLDDFFDAQGSLPDVLKIDVEGAELKVLHGMSRILSKTQPVLFLEIHPAKLPSFETTVSEVLSFLLDQGYSISAIEDRRKQDGENRLIPLSRDSAVTGTTMLYATAT